MDNRYTFTKSERLCSDKAISRLFQNGESGFVYPFRFVYLSEGAGDAETETAETTEASIDRKADGCIKLLISVSKRYHKRANKRNLNKRRIREAYRLNNHELKQLAKDAGKNINLALIYSSKDSLDYKIIENGVNKIFAILCKKLF